MSCLLFWHQTLINMLDLKIKICHRILVVFRAISPKLANYQIHRILPIFSFYTPKDLAFYSHVARTKILIDEFLESQLRGWDIFRVQIIQLPDCQLTNLTCILSIPKLDPTLVERGPSYHKNT